MLLVGGNVAIRKATVVHHSIFFFLYSPASDHPRGTRSDHWGTRLEPGVSNYGVPSASGTRVPKKLGNERHPGSPACAARCHQRRTLPRGRRAHAKMKK